jgi:hypothetical protein
MKFKGLSIAIFFSATVVFGGNAPFTVLDFEAGAERLLLTEKRGSGFFGFKKEYACSGDWSLAFNPASWKDGMNEWPAITVTVPQGRRDWRGYDKLSIDLISTKGGAEVFKCFICSGSEPIQKGSLFHLPLPEKGWKRWEIPLKQMEDKVDLSDVTRLHFFMTRPLWSEVYIDNISLVPPVQTLSLPKTKSWRMVMDDVVKRKTAADIENRKQREEMIARLLSNAKAAGRLSENFLLAKATSMEKVRPNSVDRFKSADMIYVRLARNEYEAAQLLLLPLKSMLRNVSVRLTAALVGSDGCLFPSDRVKIAPVGYVKTVYEPPYVVRPGLHPAETGWWPDPVLSFTNAVDVAKGDWQSFWISVNWPETQTAGVYSGMLEVSADGVAPVKVPFSVRVNGFVLPKTPVIPIAVTFNPGCRTHTVGTKAGRGILADSESPVNIWKKRKSEWTDHLADHLIPLFNLYVNGSSFHSSLDFGELDRLASQGRLGLINLGYWSYPAGLSESHIDAWRERTIPRLKAVYEEVKKRGWEDRACLYGCDEVKPELFNRIKLAVSELKREFPGVPLFTTAYDQDYGMTAGLEGIDWFTPLTEKFNPQKAEVARRRGKKVWWYIALNPVAPFANIFVEEHAIAARLLMGAMTQKYRPDGFLYYQCAIWNSRRCITSGPYTDWDPLSFKRYHGDGSWTCIGPDGVPIETIRLANFRDGLEDLAYARLLEKKIGREVEIPLSLVKSLTEYTEEPLKVYEWRDEMADALE